MSYKQGCGVRTQMSDSRSRNLKMLAPAPTYKPSVGNQFSIMAGRPQNELISS